MTITSKDINLIEDHLEGKFSESENTAFKKRLKGDNELKAFFNYRNKIGQLLVAARELEQNRVFVSKVIKEYKNKRINWYAVAAVIVVLVTLGSTLFFQINKNTSHKPQYTQNRTGSSQKTAIQTDRYVPDKKALLTITAPAYSLNDSIELVFDQTDNKPDLKQLIVREALSRDTIMDISLSPGQKYIRFLPGRLNKGQYEWYTNRSGLKGKFIIQ